MIRKIAALAGAWALLCVNGSIQAADGVSVEIGRGNDRTNVVRLAAQWNWRKQRPLDERWRLNGYWEVSAGAWESEDDSSADFAVTPVFRFERHSRQRVPYVEAAIGFHILSRDTFWQIRFRPAPAAPLQWRHPPSQPGDQLRAATVPVPLGLKNQGQTTFSCALCEATENVVCP
jgi:hypothetical protein